MRRARKLLGIVGPTGSGKSALALRLAAGFPAEIVSCDALQVYRGADIGTGKLPLEERRGVPHHLLDVSDPDHEFSAASYIRLAAPIIKDIDRRGKLPVVVGGTGLYLRALLRGLFDGPGRDPRLRHRISEVATRRGQAFVHRMLRRMDPASAARIHPKDLTRAVRALEVCLATKRPMSELMKERASPLAGYGVVLIGLALPRAELAKRIEKRVQGMFEKGLVDEVRRLLEHHGSSAPVIKAIGYRQVAQYLAGEIDRDEAKCLMVKATLQYAKRQMTWFRREQGVVWFTGSGEDPEARETIKEYLRAREMATPIRGARSPEHVQSTDSTETIEAIEPIGPGGSMGPIGSIGEEGVHAKTAS